MAFEQRQPNQEAGGGRTLCAPHQRGCPVPIRITYFGEPRPVASRPAEGPLTEPTPAIRCRPRERVLMPQTGRSGDQGRALDKLDRHIYPRCGDAGCLWASAGRELSCSCTLSMIKNRLGQQEPSRAPRAMLAAKGRNRWWSKQVDGHL